MEGILCGNLYASGKIVKISLDKSSDFVYPITKLAKQTGDQDEYLPGGCTESCIWWDCGRRKGREWTWEGELKRME